MDIDGLDNKKLKKALETCGTYMTEIKDDTHGHLHVEIATRKVPTIGTKWFICCSTPKEPNQHVGNFDKVLHGKVLKASWDRWCVNKDGNNDEELETEQEPEQAPEQTPSPQQPTPSATTPTI